MPDGRISQVRFEVLASRPTNQDLSMRRAQEGKALDKGLYAPRTL
jgi:hypothetical protein